MYTIMVIDDSPFIVDIFVDHASRGGLRRRLQPMGGGGLESSTR